MQNKTLKSRVLDILNYRLLNLVIAIVVVMAMPAQADLYQCTFKVKSWQKEAVPETLSIKWANYLSTPVIPSLTINKRNFGQVLLEADAFKNKVTFSWDLPPFKFPTVLSHMGHLDDGKSASVNYRVRVSRTTGKAVFNVIPKTSWLPTSSAIRLNGQCEIGK